MRRTSKSQPTASRAGSISDQSSKRPENESLLQEAVLRTCDQTPPNVRQLVTLDDGLGAELVAKEILTSEQKQAVSKIQNDEAKRSAKLFKCLRQQPSKFPQFLECLKKYNTTAFQSLSEMYTTECKNVISSKNPNLSELKSANLFRTVNVPTYQSDYFRRAGGAVDNSIFRGLTDVVLHPGEGVLCIAGAPGAGKSRLVATVVTDLPWMLENDDYKQIAEDGLEIVVFWLNCLDHRDRFDKNEFERQLGELAKQADATFQGNTGQIAGHFWKTKKRALFVLDDMFNSDLLDHFIGTQRDAALLSCIVITRNPVPMSWNNSRTRRTIVVDPLDSKDFKMLFSAFYSLPPCTSNPLPDDRKLRHIEKFCGGWPLLIQITASIMQYHPEALLEITALENTKSIVNDKRFDKLADFLKFSLENALPPDVLENYWYFLLFDPVESVLENWLQFIWGDKFSLVKNCCIPNSLVRSVKTKATGSEEDAIQVHQTLYDTALNMSAEHYGIASNSVGLTANDNAKRDELQQLRQFLIAKLGSRYFQDKPDYTNPINGAFYTLAFLQQVLNSNKVKFAERLTGSLSRYCFEAAVNEAAEPVSEDFKEKVQSKLKAETKKAKTLTGFLCSNGLINLLKVMKIYFPATLEAEAILFDSSGQTPVHHVAESGQEAIFKFLVGVNPELATMPNKDGKTPAYIAAKHEHAGVVSLLVGASAEAKNIKDKDGLTAAHLAARDGQTAIVKFLVGVNPELATMQENNRRTPCHLAAYKGHEATVKFLIAFNRELASMQDTTGKTPSQILKK